MTNLICQDSLRNDEIVLVNDNIKDNFYVVKYKRSVSKSARFVLYVPFFIDWANVKLVRKKVDDLPMLSLNNSRWVGKSKVDRMMRMMNFEFDSAKFSKMIDVLADDYPQIWRFVSKDSEVRIFAGIIVQYNVLRVREPLINYLETIKFRDIKHNESVNSYNNYKLAFVRLVGEIVEYLQFRSKGLNNSASAVNFEKYIDSWAKRLMQDPTLGGQNVH